MTRLFFRYPWLLFALALFLILNNIFKWYPNSVQDGGTQFFVPGMIILLGVIGYVGKWLRSRSGN